MRIVNIILMLLFSINMFPMVFKIVEPTDYMRNVVGIINGKNGKTYYFDSDTICEYSVNKLNELVRAKNSWNFQDLYICNDSTIYSLISIEQKSEICELREGEFQRLLNIGGYTRPFLDSKDRLWACNDKSEIIYVKNGKVNRLDSLAILEDISPGEKSNVYSFFEDLSGRIWISARKDYSSNGGIVKCFLYCYSKDSFLRVFADSTFSDIPFVAEVSKDLFWIQTINTKEFKVEFRKNTVKLIESGSLEEGFNAQSIFMDSRNRCWIIGWNFNNIKAGQYLNGILYRVEGGVKKIIFKEFDMANSYRIGEKRPFLELADGSIIFGSNGTGAYKVNTDDSVQNIWFENGLNIATIRGLFFDKKGDICFSGYSEHPYYSKIFILDKSTLKESSTWAGIKRTVSIGTIRKAEDGAFWYVDSGLNLVRNYGKGAEITARVSDLLNEAAPVGIDREEIENLKPVFRYFTMDNEGKKWLFFDCKKSTDRPLTVILFLDGKKEILEVSEAYKRYYYTSGISFVKGHSFDEDPFDPVINGKHELLYYSEDKTRIKCYDGALWDTIKLGKLENEFISPIFLDSNKQALISLLPNYKGERMESFIVENKIIESSAEYIKYRPQKKSNYLVLPNGRANRTYSLDLKTLKLKDDLVVDPPNKLLYGGEEIFDGLGIAPNTGGRRLKYFSDEDVDRVVFYDSDKSGKVWINSRKHFSDITATVFEWFIIDTEKRIKEIDEAFFYVRNISRLDKSPYEGEVKKEYTMKEPLEAPAATLGIEISYGKKTTFYYSLDGEDWKQSAALQLTLQKLGMGQHVLKLKKKNSSEAESPSAFRFEVRYDELAILEKIWQTCNCGDQKKENESITKLLEYGDSSKKYLLKKKKEVTEDRLLWKIDAVLSRMGNN